MRDSGRDTSLAPLLTGVRKGVFSSPEGVVPNIGVESPFDLDDCKAK